MEVKRKSQQSQYLIDWHKELNQNFTYSDNYPYSSEQKKRLDDFALLFRGSQYEADANLYLAAIARNTRDQKSVVAVADLMLSIAKQNPDRAIKVGSLISQISSISPKSEVVLKSVSRLSLYAKSHNGELMEAYHLLDYVNIMQNIMEKNISSNQHLPKLRK
jgi:hypothetical protein